MEGPSLEQKPSLIGFERISAVQDLLNCNKILISEINTNHEAGSPEGLARNVVLIRELNKNLAEVLKIYQDFCNSVDDLTKKEAHAGQIGPLLPQT